MKQKILTIKMKKNTTEWGVDAERIKRQVDSAFSKNYDHVVLNLAHVHTIDSALVGQMLVLKKTYEAKLSVILSDAVCKQLSGMAAFLKHQN